MKAPETKLFKEVLQSLQPYPQMQFLLFANRWGDFEQELLDFCLREEHSILLYALGDFNQESIKESSYLKYRPYRKEQSRYNLQGKLYNHAFITADIPDNKEAFTTKIYTGVANAGGVYILSNYQESQKWQKAFEQSNYLANSTIELNRDNILVYARKMHGWGS